MTNEERNHIDWDKLIELIDAGQINEKNVLLTEEERELVRTFLALKANMGKGLESFDTLEALSKVKERIAIQKATAQQAKIVRLKRRRWLYAAAVLLPLIIVAGLLFNKNKETWTVLPPVSARAEAPGVKLTLASGEAIVLSENKSITDKGAAIAQAQNGTLAYNNANASADREMRNVLDVPRGRKYNLVLSDGTKVWMNAESSLSYPVNFSGNTREVTLTGEAYFEVTHNAEKPFIVHTQETAVQVLGTSFDVSAYKTEATFATLVEGRVKVNAGQREVLLQPGEQSVKEKGNDALSKKEVDTDEFVAWKNDRLLFKDASLFAITERLGRAYNYTFVFENDTLKKAHCTISLVQTPDISSILEHLAKARIINYSIKGNEVYVSEIK
jgi:ferric-dicitrate binding protein FerR (iron transport regulator)